MMDARRWVLVETWLSLGLKLRWADYSDRHGSDKPWQVDEDGKKYIYAGDKEWCVLPPHSSSRYSTPTEPPALHSDTLLHELAHYLTSSTEERWEVNFGLKEPGDVRSEEREQLALDAETALAAVVAASARIAMIALMGGDR